MKLFKRDENCNKHGHSPIRHMLHMVLCCGLPLIILFTLPYIAVISPAAAGVLAVISPFICPVMMGIMMLMMFRSGKSSCCKETEQGNNHLETSIK